MSVGSAGLEPEAPKEIVRIIGMNFPHSGGDYPTYAVSKDGKRVLMVQVVNNGNPNTANVGGGDAVGPDPPLSITVAMNWASSLNK